MNEEYLSISEFAKRAGVSRPTIYSKLDNELSSYCKVVKGKKTISIKALALFSVKESVKNVTNNESLLQMISILQSQTEMLKEQLEVKDRQIEAKERHIEELTKILDQQQQLHAIAEKKRLETSAEPVIVEPTPEPAPPDPDEENLSDQEIYKRALEKLPPMPGLWDRLFEKKVDAWREAQNIAISKMTDKEREVLYKFGFIGDGK